MLGLGDIVIPGIFVALILRYDATVRKYTTSYFWRCVSWERHELNGSLVLHGPQQPGVIMLLRSELLVVLSTVSTHA